MANICETELSIYFWEPEEAAEFLKKFESWIDGDRRVSHICEKAGIDCSDEQTFNHSEITDYFMSRSEILIYINSAWTPPLMCWGAILLKHAPDTTLYFRIYEPGFGICKTNDPNYIGEFFVDYYGDEDIDSNDCAEPNDVIGILQKVLHTDATDFKFLITTLKETPNAKCSVMQWKASSLADWD